MFRPNPQRSDTRSALGTAALLLVPVLCCAGPALLGVATLTATAGVIGAWLLNPWLLGAAGLLTLAALGWRLRPRATSSLRPAACPPEHPAQSVDTDRSPISHQER
ncbi:hypothetical protein [Pseudonocardia sp. GCM10023141]|uniref:hypothetical protein n=1 Tax=Pseudonocardia sp. GCM10023141 TaxID=3252653 RepID=UPI00361781F6